MENRATKVASCGSFRRKAGIQWTLRGRREGPGEHPPGVPAIAGKTRVDEDTAVPQIPASLNPLRHSRLRSRHGFSAS